MDIHNRNQVFLAGMVFLLLGIQFHFVDAFVLTPRATKLLAEQSGHPVATAGNTLETLMGTQAPIPSKAWQPPEWLGWCLMSIGSVLILHSWTLPKPG
jgi:hypothetical protein